MKIYDKSTKEFLNPFTLSFSAIDIHIQLTFKYKNDFNSTTVYIEPIYKNKQYIKVSYRFSPEAFASYRIIKGKESDCEKLRKEVWDNDKIIIESVDDMIMPEHSGDNFLGWKIDWDSIQWIDDYEKIITDWSLSNEEKTKIFMDWVLSQKDKLNDDVESITLRFFEK